MLKSYFSMRRLAVSYGLAVALIIALVDTGHLRTFTKVVGLVHGGDKLAHFVLMGLFACTVVLALGWTGQRDARRAASLGARGVFAVVLLEELSQRWVATRTFDWIDLTADAAGIVVGAGLSCVWLRRRTRAMAALAG